MEGAEAIPLTSKHKAFLDCLNWMENTTYLGEVFVLDIVFDDFGATLYGPQERVNEFKSDMEKYRSYIEQEDGYGYTW